jgi:hypothetical protein
VSPGALGGDREVGPRPRQSADGGGGVDVASLFSCAEVEAEKNGGGKKLGPRYAVDGRTGGSGQCMVRQEEWGSGRR